MERMRIVSVILPALVSFASCDEPSEKEDVSWGVCGPHELAEQVPKEALAAVEAAVAPGGMAWNMLLCSENISLGPPYRDGDVIPTKVDGPETPDDFIEFENAYLYPAFCGKKAGSLLRTEYLQGTWQMVQVGGSAAWTTALAQSGIGQQDGCTLGYFTVNEPDYSFAILTQAGSQYIFPLSFSGGETYGKTAGVDTPGEVYLTKQEFLEWLDAKDL